MSNSNLEGSTESQSTLADGFADSAVNAASPNAASEVTSSRNIVTRLRRFFWLDERIANAQSKYLGPTQAGWREFILAKDVREAVEDIRESGQSRYSLALLLRAQVLLLIRCHRFRAGLGADGDALAITDWGEARKLPQLEALAQNLPSGALGHVQGILGERSESYLLGIEPAKLKEVGEPLREIATALSEPLEREAGIVKRLLIARYSRLAVAAAMIVVALTLAFGWFADHSGRKNLALNRAVTVSTQAPGLFADHHLLVDGDHTNVGFHTETLPNQYVVIDLGSSMKFDKVVVYNRVDCCQDRAVPLQLEVSDDNLNFKKLALRSDPFDVWTASMLRAKGRYVRLRLLANNCFHLAEVEVY